MTFLIASGTWIFSLWMISYIAISKLIPQPRYPPLTSKFTWTDMSIWSSNRYLHTNACKSGLLIHTSTQPWSYPLFVGFPIWVNTLTFTSFSSLEPKSQLWFINFHHSHLCHLTLHQMLLNQRALLFMVCDCPNWGCHNLILEMPLQPSKWLSHLYSGFP